MIVDRYNAGFKNLLALGQSQYANVFEGSFTDFDWSNGDVVFANSTCFSDELMAELSQQAEKLKPGAIVVTFTKGMTSKAFEMLERERDIACPGDPPPSTSTAASITMENPSVPLASTSSLVTQPTTTTTIHQRRATRTTCHLTTPTPSTPQALDPPPPMT